MSGFVRFDEGLNMDAQINTFGNWEGTVCAFFSFTIGRFTRACTRKPIGASMTRRGILDLNESPSGANTAP